jgi:hypothetical protein
MSAFEEKAERPSSKDDNDFENSSSAHDASMIEPSDVSIEAERKLIRKLDLQLIPVIVLLYLFSFLDRGMSPHSCVELKTKRGTTVNIGNARLYGIEEDLGLKKNQYQVCVSILFVTYCVSH